MSPQLQHGASAGASAAVCSGAGDLAGVRLELVLLTSTAQVRARGDRNLLSCVFRDRERCRTPHSSQTSFFSLRGGVGCHGLPGTLPVVYNLVNQPEQVLLDSRHVARFGVFAFF